MSSVGLDPMRLSRLFTRLRNMSGTRPETMGSMNHLLSYRMTKYSEGKSEGQTEKARHTFVQVS